MGRVQDLTGKVFGKWTVIERAGTYENNNCATWLCECSCEEKTKRELLSSYLTQGKSKSCGCFRKEKMTKHGKRNTRIYHIYTTMIQRCYNQNSKHYENYGAKGVSVCDDWLCKENGFNNFLEWAMKNGYEDDLSIDRIEVSGNYSPENCRWTTIAIQNNNKRNTIYITIDGVEKTLRDWEREHNLPRNTIFNRLQRGFTGKDLLKPVKNKSKSKQHSGVKGIFWNNTHNKWHVRPREDGKAIHIGLYDDLEDAKKALLNYNNHKGDN